MTQVAHGFVVGDVLRVDGTDVYAKAQADTEANAEVVGIVVAVADVDNFSLLSVGWLDGLSGLTAETVYYLSPTTAGALTATEPTTSGQVSKPLLWASEADAGYFFNQRGSVVGTPVPNDGWIEDDSTWTFATATTFTVAGDQTAKFPKGAKIRLTQTTVKYFYVVARSFAAGTTTVTVAAGTDYSLANAAITSPAYSYAETPQGFPVTFAFTPTWGSDGSAPSLGNGTLSGLFSMHGTMVRVNISMTAGGTSTFGTGTYKWALPTRAKTGIHLPGAGWVLDSGSQEYNAIPILATATDIAMRTWSATQTNQYVGQAAPMTWAANDAMQIAAWYEVE